MKKKKSLNKIIVNSASHAGIALEKASTYSSDWSLFNSLGLKPFIDIPSNKEYFVGEVKLKNDSVVKIWVCPMPALFWKFEVSVEGRKRITKVSTGSGALSDFWNAIKLIAENMLVVETTETKS
jgi:hypothetical protein